MARSLTLAKTNRKPHIVCRSILPETFFELLASTFESLSPLGQAIGKILFGVVEHCKMGFIAGQLKIHLHRASTRHNYCYFICNI